MSTWTQRAFDLVTEISKQVITLSTAVIALGITFGRDFAQSGAGSNPWWWGTSWVLFLLAIIFAIGTLMASTGTQATMDAQGNARASTGTPAKASTASPSPYQGSVRLFGALQLTCFLLGLVMSVVAGIVSL